MDQRGVEKLQVTHTRAVVPPEGKLAVLERPDGGFRGSRDSPIEIRNVDLR